MSYLDFLFDTVGERIFPPEIKRETSSDLGLNKQKRKYVSKKKILSEKSTGQKHIFLNYVEERHLPSRVR